MFSTYVQSIGLSEFLDQVPSDTPRSLLSKVPQSPPKPLTIQQLSALYSYKVPTLSADGSCNIQGHIDPTPYSLRSIFHLSKDLDQLKHHPITNHLWRLNQIVERIQSVTKVDWLGIYLKKQNVLGESVLVKVAYSGRISRAEFPLTEEFATHSNNTTVGLTGKTVFFQDLSSYSGPYYECDVQVKSECCLPILSKNNDILGIIDAESFTTHFFNRSILQLLAQLSWELGLDKFVSSTLDRD